MVISLSSFILGPEAETIRSWHETLIYYLRSLRAPSIFAKCDSKEVDSWMNLQPSLKFKIHRPSVKEFGLPTTLLHPAFGKFVDTFNNRHDILNRNDYEFATYFSNAMSDVYEGRNGEAKRNAEANRLLSEYLNKSVKRTNLGFGVSQTDGSVFANIGTVMSSEVLTLILEVKNEMGVGGCDPSIQGLGYYLQCLANTESPSMRFAREYTVMPVLLVCISGPNIAFYFIANYNTAVMDPATPYLSCLFLPYDVPQMTLLAGSLRAMKEYVMVLDAEYKAMLMVNKSSDMIHAYNPALEQLKYPYYKSFVLSGGLGTVELEYEFQFIDKLVFIARTKTNIQSIPTQVIVKFTRSYCIEAHNICHTCHQGAPQLFHSEKLSGGWIVVVMEKLEHMVESKSFTDAQYSSLHDIINKMHSHGYVHGDLRNCNILIGAKKGQVINANRVCLIDFDWSGVEGSVRYPGFMNHKTVHWPKGASDGAKICKDHDLHFFNVLQQPVGN